MSGGQRKALGPWIALAIVMAVVGPSLVFSSVFVQGGYCLDADPGSGAQSFCTSGPQGGPGVIVVAVACGLILAFAIHRIIRIVRERRR